MTDLCEWKPAKSNVFPDGDAERSGKYVVKMTNITAVSADCVS